MIAFDMYVNNKEKFIQKYMSQLSINNKFILKSSSEEMKKINNDISFTIKDNLLLKGYSEQDFIITETDVDSFFHENEISFKIINKL